MIIDIWRKLKLKTLVYYAVYFSIIAKVMLKLYHV